jgi:hypothetical protein
MYAYLEAVRKGLNCKRCQRSELTQDEQNTLDGLYCHGCRQKYDCSGRFDSNSDALSSHLVSLVPSLVLVSQGQGIPGSATRNGQTRLCLSLFKLPCRCGGS